MSDPAPPPQIGLLGSEGMTHLLLWQNRVTLLLRCSVKEGLRMSLHLDLLSPYHTQSQDGRSWRACWLPTGPQAHPLYANISWVTHQQSMLTANSPAEIRAATTCDYL